MTSRWMGSGTPHARLQYILAVVAIAAAVALPVVLVSVGGGVAAHELTALQQSGYEISISAGGTHGVNHAHPLSAQIRALADVAAASPVLSASIDAYLPGSSNATVVAAEGVIPDEFEATLGPAEAGLFPNPLPIGDPSDLAHFDGGTYSGPATYDVLVASPLAQAANLSIGESIHLSPGPDPRLGVSYNVTGTFGVSPGLLGPTGAFAVIVPLSDLQVLDGAARGGPNGSILLDGSDTIQVALAGASATDPNAISAVAAEIQSLVPYYGVTTQIQQAQQLQQASAILTGFYLGLSSVGIVVGLLFLAIVLVRRVESDRRSIGIRRAVGVPGHSIAASVVGRGVLLAASGAIAGTIAGVLIIQSLDVYGTSAVQAATRLAVFDPVLLGAIGASIVALSLIAGAFATRAALRLDLAEALR